MDATLQYLRGAHLVNLNKLCPFILSNTEARIEFLDLDAVILQANTPVVIAHGELEGWMGGRGLNYAGIQPQIQREGRALSPGKFSTRILHAPVKAGRDSIHALPTAIRYVRLEKSVTIPDGFDDSKCFDAHPF